jgi:hypothetical protein
MKLQQNQLWQKGDEYFRIVHRDRLTVVYKTFKNPVGARGAAQKNATKKEFCRLIKGAVLLDAPPQSADSTLPGDDEDEDDILEFDPSESPQAEIKEDDRLPSPEAPPKE